MELIVVIVVVVIATLTVIALSGCAPGGVVEQEITPGHYARVCEGPDPAHVAAWHADLRKSGTSDLPMPLPNCEDVWIPPVTETRPAHWGDAWGIPIEPGLPLSYEPACGGPVTDYQTGVVFCARDNDRGRDQNDAGAGVGGAPADDSGRPGTDTPDRTDSPSEGPDGPNGQEDRCEARNG